MLFSTFRHRTRTMNTTHRLGTLALALAACLSAHAEPAVVYDMGG